MKLDHEKFNNAFVTIQKRAMRKIIENTKSGCRLSVTADNSMAAALWGARWRQAVVFLRVINAVQVYAAKCETIGAVITEFEKRAKRASKAANGGESKLANEYAVQRLKDYRESLKQKAVA